MGLMKGEKIKRLGYIRILSIRTEPLHAITQEDCIKEGFPEKEPAEFVKMICDHYGCNEWHPVQRIEFEHIEINVRRKSGRAYNGAAREAGTVTTVDRTYEFAKPDNEIVVTLEDGHTQRFWLTGLTDEEYIKRARYLRDNA